MFPDGPKGPDRVNDYDKKCAKLTYLLRPWALVTGGSAIFLSA